MTERLETFIDTLVQDITYIIENIPKLAPGYSDQRYRELDSAWKEILENEYPHKLKRNISEKKASLRDHGLGTNTDQLSFKLDTVEEVRDGFNLVMENMMQIPYQDISDAIISIIAAPITSEYLSAADNVLESIIDAIPGVGAEPIKEIKDFILDLIP